MRLISTAEQKWELWEEVGRHCEWCDDYTDPNDIQTQRHHVLVPRNRLKRAQQITDDAHIDERINIVLLCIMCHQIGANDYQHGYDIQVDLFGTEEVQDFMTRMLPRTHGG